MVRSRTARWIGSSAPLHRAPRDAPDDFYCLRYRVWYPSPDCAYRTLYRTCPGCRRCEQGRFNLKRHRNALLRGQAAGRTG